MNEVVRYSTNMHTVALGKLKPADTRVFFALCQRLKEQGEDEIELKWSELRSLANLTGDRHPERFVKRLERITDNLAGLMIRGYYESGWEAFTLFKKFRVDVVKKTISVSVAPAFEYLLNELHANFVHWKLPDYTKLKGKYSQSIYRYLMQWRSTGKWDAPIDEFRRVLDIPVDYRMTNITQKVINPALAELRPLFHGLTCQYYKPGGPGGQGRGGKVERIIFTYQQAIDYKLPAMDEPYDVEPLPEDPPELSRALKEQQEMIEESHEAQRKRKIEEARKTEWGE